MQSMTNDELEPKLNWLQKIQLRLISKRAIRRIKQAQQNIQDEAERRLKTELALLELTKIFTIEINDGQLLTNQNINTLTQEELETTLEDALKQLERL